MTVQAFQRAVSDFIASPSRCRALRAQPDFGLEKYDLSPRERRRLVEVVRQPGMSTNCTLYRSNRITPIYTLLQSTCFILGDAFPREIDKYWEDSEFEDLQFAQEIERFGCFLRRRIEAKAIDEPLVEEVLNFELAWNAVRFIPRRRILRELDATPIGIGGRKPRLHPLLRIVRFTCDPMELLELLAERHPLPYDLREGEFFLLLCAGRDGVETELVDAKIGQMLLAIVAGKAEQVGQIELASLLRTGHVIR